MLSAQRLMEVNGAEKTWLEDVGQYYTEYVNNNITYKIWFEDVRTYTALVFARIQAQIKITTDMINSSLCFKCPASRVLLLYI